MKKTRLDKMLIGLGIVGVAFAGGVIYVVVHFLVKYW